MGTISDQKYLKNDQYRNGGNLDARIQLHRRFSTNPANFHNWVFDQLKLRSGMHVMEAGCGTGEFWRANLDRLPANVLLSLFDLSFGMAGVARSTFQMDARFSFGAADIQDLPFKDGQFDAVLANHMLYHVPDIAQGVRELRRVLKPGGWLCTTTNGTGHLRELRDLLCQFGIENTDSAASFARYGLDNASAILGECFEKVEVIPFIDSLFVTETEALMAFIRSMMGLWNVPEAAMVELEKRITTEIATKGGFSISKAGGVVLAW